MPTLFIHFGEETRKVTGEVETFESMLKLFKDRYAERAIDFKSKEDICFYTKDQQYGVAYEIEDFDKDVYEGAVVEVRIPERDPDATLRAELARLNEQIRSLEEKDQSAAKRRKVERNFELKEDAQVARIRGLPWGSNEQTVREFFEGLSIVKDGIHLVTDWQDRPNGEAYVEFSTEDDCNRAKQKHNEKIGTRYIEVFPATGMEMYRARVPPTPGALPVKSSENLILKMRGLPFGSNETEVTNFFHGTPIERIHMTKNSRGTPNGEAFVEFKSEKELEMAMKYEREKIGARYIELFKVSQTEASLPKYWV